MTSKIRLSCTPGIPHVLQRLVCFLGWGNARRPPWSTAHRGVLGGRNRAATALAVTVLVATSACSGATPTPTGAPSEGSGGPSWQPHVPAASPAAADCRTVLVADGDIVDDAAVADQTGRVAAAQQPDAVLVLGDNQYPGGSLTNYRNRYDHTAWGRLKPITNPVPGNHEYRTADAAGYFAYFDHPASYYSYDAGCGWRAYALNSEIGLGPQIDWLRRDLRAHPAAPVVVSWHRPRWSSGSEHGDNPDLQPFWDALAGRTGVVLNGHEHNYERFAPVGALREFVVGTGGSSRYSSGSPVHGSQRRIADTPGVLRLVLRRQSGYQWTFLDTAGRPLDTGTG